MDLFGIPHRLVLGDKGLAKGRRDKEPREIAHGDISTVSKVIKSER